ncbi:MAG: OFA family MFS transporter [Balneolales bacterium]
MSKKKVMNRWWVVVGALVIQVSLGAVYIWSVFQSPLLEYFPTWTESQVTMPAQIVLASFAIAVIFGGRIQDRLGPGIVATTGGIILGSGLILARFAEFFEPSVALAWLIFTYAILGGIGIGAAYVCPIATCVKWFPDKRGLVTGLAVAGFGAGAFFFAPLGRALTCGDSYTLLGIPFFNVPQVGVFNAFMILGVIFFVIVVAGAQLLRNPPDGYKPEGWNAPDVSKAAGAAGKTDYTPAEMLRSPAFWLLWVTYLVGCTAGLQVIMKISPIWQSFSFGSMPSPISYSTYLSVTAAGASAVSILAIFNSFGRILWGKISDMIDRRYVLAIMFLLCGIAMLMLDWLQLFPLYLIGISIVGLCFGGYLAVYPAITADFFGTKNIGANYGWMFTAYGAGGIFGPYLAARLMRVVESVPYNTLCPKGTPIEALFTVGDYRLAFWISGIACLVAALVVIQIKPHMLKKQPR